MPLSRRELIGRSAALAAGMGVATALPANAGPPRRYATGPLAGVYGEIGAPRGRVLSYGPDTSSRWVTWLTTGEQPTRSIVSYGVVPRGTPPGQGARAKLLRTTVEGTSEIAPKGQFDQGSGKATPIEGEYAVRVHRVLLTGLPAGAEVAYRVGDGTRWSDIRSFVTPKAPDRFRLAHFGDHGTRTASRRTVSTVAARGADAVLLAGDITYANGHQPTWDVWAGQAERLVSRTPVLPAPGNHEALDFYGATYRARFAHPQRGRNWYAIDLGRMHLFSGTAGCFLTPNDPLTARDLVVDELVGLETDLALAAARRAAGEIDFLVVAQHFPLFTNQNTRGPFSPDLVVAQEHILQRYGVDLVLVGHDHMYQRSHPMSYGAATGSGAGYVQVVAGAGGQGLYEFADPNAPTWGDWCAAWSRRFSFVEYDVAPGRVTATAWGWDDAQAKVVDENADAVDPALRPAVIDRFVVERRSPAALRAAVLPPRPAAEIVAGVPEAHGTVVRNVAEDCTRHHH